MVISFFDFRWPLVNLWLDAHKPYMNTVNPESILNVITDFYLSSRQFKGISAGRLFEMIESDWQEFYDLLQIFVSLDY